jgi:hypothetical protein
MRWIAWRLQYILSHHLARLGRIPLPSVCRPHCETTDGGGRRWGTNAPPETALHRCRKVRSRPGNASSRRRRESVA